MTPIEFIKAIARSEIQPKATMYRFNRIGYYRNSAVMILREEGVDFVCKRLASSGFTVGQEFDLPKCEVKVIGERGRVL